MRKSVIIRGCICAGCVICSFLSLSKINTINQYYKQEQKLHVELMEYRPAEQEEPKEEDKTDAVTNQSVLDLQAVNPDAAGWITIPGTIIDYPFVWAADYDQYLRTDIYHQESVSGTIFIDYRCDRNFKDFNTILYGHNMDNGSVFGVIPQYRDQEFFNGHKKAYIYLPHQNIEAEVAACLVVDAGDEIIYGTHDTVGERQMFIQKVRESTKENGESDFSANDRFITLSTCDYSFTGARSVLILKVLEN